MNFLLFSSVFLKPSHTGLVSGVTQSEACFSGVEAWSDA